MTNRTKIIVFVFRALCLLVGLAIGFTIGWHGCGYYLDNYYSPPAGEIQVLDAGNIEKYDNGDNNYREAERGF